MTYLPLGVGIAVFLFVLWRARGANAQSIEGISQMNRGRYSAALDSFEAFRKRQPNSPVGLYNAALVRVALWQPEEAAALLERAVGKSGPRVNLAAALMDIRSMALPILALACALAGRDDAAKQWIETCRQTGEGDNANTLLADAVLACRQGRWVDARATLIRPELYQLGGRGRALSEALLSWATHGAGGPMLPLNKVAFYWETGPERVGKVWPELVEHVDRAPSV